jgi:dephospho-CoA kinase
LKSRYGFPVIDADVLAREVVQPGSRGLKQIASHFGELDRAKLGRIIFNDPAKRKVVNGIIHPAVSRAMFWAVVKCWILGYKVCVLDVPLLIEAGIWQWVGKVVVVFW